MVVSIVSGPVARQSMMVEVNAKQKKMIHRMARYK